MVEERWLSIAGFPGYEVSDLGSVRSWRPKNGRGELGSEPHPRKSTRAVGGYRRVTLSNGGAISSHLVHRLVLEAFEGPCPPGMQTRHLDGDPANNAKSNLQWAAVLVNHADKQRHGTTARGERQGCARLTETQVREVRRRIASGKWTHGDGRAFAKLFGVSPSAISLIRREKKWLHVTESVVLPTEGIIHVLP